MVGKMKARENELSTAQFTNIRSSWGLIQNSFQVFQCLYYIMKAQNAFCDFQIPNKTNPNHPINIFKGLNFYNHHTFFRIIFKKV